MNAAVKNAVESALIALLVAAVCLGLLIAGNNGEEEISALRATMLGLGIGVANLAHWIFMAQALKHSGRPMLPWLLAIIALTPIGTLICLAVLMSGNKPQQRQPN